MGRKDPASSNLHRQLERHEYLGHRVGRQKHSDRRGRFAALRRGHRRSTKRDQSHARKFLCARARGRNLAIAPSDFGNDLPLILDLETGRELDWSTNPFPAQTPAYLAAGIFLLLAATALARMKRRRRARPTPRSPRCRKGPAGNSFWSASSVLYASGLRSAEFWSGGPSASTIEESDRGFQINRRPGGEVAAQRLRRTGRLLASMRPTARLPLRGCKSPR